MGTIMFAVAQLWHPRLVPFIILFVPICALFELAVVRPVRGFVLAAMLKMNVLRAEGESEECRHARASRNNRDCKECCMAKQSEIRIGISGWRYAPWRETFYPKGLRQKDEGLEPARESLGQGKRTTERNPGTACTAQQAISPGCIRIF